MRTFLATAGCFLFTAAPLAAQDESQAVMATVQQLFDGMRSQDTAKMRAVLHPDARLITTGIRDGAPVVSTVSPDRWLAGVAGATVAILDERLRNTVVYVEGGLASVWTDYTLYIGERLSHCGVDAFHLVRTAEGWRIIDLADTRRRENCPP
ncbi:MAG: nuclear transport factor 2 family protein [Gemmatimonadales bacterium]